MSTFSRSNRLVEDVQSVVLGLPISRNKWVKILYDYAVYPLLYLYSGAKTFGKGFLLWTAYFFAVYSAVELVTLTYAVSASLSWLILLAPFVFIFFAAPSTYSTHGIKEKDVLMGQSLLLEKRLLHLAEIEAVLLHVREREDVVTKRISRLRWGVASLWGIFIYTLQVSFTTLMDTPIADIEPVIEEFTPLIGTMLLIVLGSVIAVEAYAATKTRIFKVARYALYEARLDKQVEDEMDTTDSAKRAESYEFARWKDDANSD